MAEDESSAPSTGIPVPRFLLSGFVALAVLAIGGLSVRLISLVVDVNGFQIRMAHIEQVVSGNSFKLYSPRWSANQQRDYETRHQELHNDHRAENRTDLAALRSECFSSLQETQRRMEVHENTGAHVRADERLSKLETDVAELKKGE